MEREIEASTYVDDSNLRSHCDYYVVGVSQKKKKRRCLFRRLFVIVMRGF